MLGGAASGIIKRKNVIIGIIGYRTCPVCHVCQGSYLRFAGLFVLFSTLYMLLAADADQRKIKSAAIRCHCRGQASSSMSPERLHLKVSKDLKGIGPAIASLCTVLTLTHSHHLTSMIICKWMDGEKKKNRKTQDRKIDR